ncbi:AMP-binding protein [Pseudonocardia lutea]|uniref:AMP-binding protein n=1 Tax=Pseudonocardia lutea TaxID=2172015 RepID=A0ABW1I9R1_9PSEU
MPDSRTPVPSPSEPVPPTESTIGAAVEAAAQRWPEACGWVFEDRRITFSEMRDLAARAATGLHACGVRRGDVVALWTPNLAEWAVTAFAAYRLGAVVLSINTRFKGFELTHLLSHSRAKVLIIQPQFLGIDFEELLEGVAPDLMLSPTGQATTASFPSLQRLISVSPGRLSAMDWSALLDTAPADTTALDVDLTPDSPALLQYTSGTTAAPKGALLNHRHLLNYAPETFSRLGVRAGDPVLNTQPVYHVGGASALTVPLVLGCTKVTPGHYDAGRVLELMERERCVSRGGIPTMYLMEMAHPRFAEFDLSALRSGWTGGPPAVMDQIRDGFGGLELIQLYGATEGGGTSGCITDPWEKRRVTAGRPMTGTELRIIDPETGREVPAGEVGEICIRGWNRMIGYFRDDERTQEVVDAHGWLHMGDLGRFDEEGYLTYVGRLKDMIRVGGENTSAEEVEALLLEHPSVHQAAVIGVPDVRMGEVVLAIVERAAGSSLTAEEIVVHCKSRAANFRVPRHVRFVTDWPYTGSGKIAKKVLRDIYTPEFEITEQKVEVS